MTLEPEDSSIILNGANTFDVSGEGLKEFKLNIYGLKQAQNKTTINFRNLATNEFIFFKIVKQIISIILESYYPPSRPTPSFGDDIHCT